MTREKKEKKYIVKGYDTAIIPMTLNALEEQKTALAKLCPYIDAAIESFHQNEKNPLWNTVWEIQQKKEDHLTVGYFWFEGIPIRGALSIGFFVYPKFRNRGYAKDAIRTMTSWALAQKNIYSITIEVAHDNDSAIAVLEKSGYVYRAVDRKTESYTITKQKTVWLGLYMFIGVCVGLALGIVFGSMLIGLLIGMFACMAMGAIMDNKAAKERSGITGESISSR